MKSFYVIQDIDNQGYWSVNYGRFKGFLFADEFETKQKAIQQAIEDNVGIFKITEIYDTK